MGIINIEIIANLITNVKHGQADVVAYGSENMDLIYDMIANRIAEVSYKLCPKDTEYLVSTLKVVKNSIGTRSIIYTAPYALYVHEIIDNWHAHPTQAKYLEDAGWIVLSEFKNGILFTFTMEYNSDGSIALHLDSISLDDFKHNMKIIYDNYNIINNGTVEDLDKLRDDYIGVEEDIYYETW